MHRRKLCAGGGTATRIRRCLRKFPQGQNPPDGAILDYYLASRAHGPVTLEILDADGALVRRYSSTDEPPSMDRIAAEYPIPMYWVRPPQILSAAAGMHRFVWDLRYAPPEALEHEFPISAIIHDTTLHPLGARALSGSLYRQTYGRWQKLTQPLSLKMDPRIQTPLADLHKQFDMEIGSAGEMDRSFDALAQVKSVRTQVKELVGKVKGKEKLAKELATLDNECAELEGATQHSFYGVPPSGRQAENFSTLNQHFSVMLAVADSADAAPTTQAASAFQDLEQTATALHKRWGALRERDIANVNGKLKKAGLPAIDPTKPLAGELGGASDGDDEP